MLDIVEGQVCGILADWDHAGLDEPSTDIHSLKKKLNIDKDV